MYNPLYDLEKREIKKEKKARQRESRTRDEKLWMDRYLEITTGKSVWRQECTIGWGTAKEEKNKAKEISKSRIDSDSPWIKKIIPLSLYDNDKEDMVYYWRPGIRGESRGLKRYAPPKGVSKIDVLDINPFSSQGHPDSPQRLGPTPRFRRYGAPGEIPEHHDVLPRSHVDRDSMTTQPPVSLLAPGGLIRYIDDEFLEDNALQGPQAEIVSRLPNNESDDHQRVEIRIQNVEDRRRRRRYHQRYRLLLRPQRRLILGSRIIVHAKLCEPLWVQDELATYLLDPNNIDARLIPILKQVERRNIFLKSYYNLIGIRAGHLDTELNSPATLRRIQDIKDRMSSEKRMAFAKGLHNRLGENSEMVNLEESQLLETITTETRAHLSPGIGAGLPRRAHLAPIGDIGTAFGHQRQARIDDWQRQAHEEAERVIVQEMDLEIKEMENIMIGETYSEWVARQGAVGGRQASRRQSHAGAGGKRKTRKSKRRKTKTRKSKRRKTKTRKSKRRKTKRRKR
jgi:hypothetical protein